MARGPILAPALASFVFLGTLPKTLRSFFLCRMCMHLIKVLLLHGKHWAQHVGSPEMLAAVRQMATRTTHAASGKTCSTEPRWGTRCERGRNIRRVFIPRQSPPGRSGCPVVSGWAGSVSGSWCGLNSPEWSVSLGPGRWASAGCLSGK